MIRAYVVDDEPLALRRLVRLLEDTGRVVVAGSSSDPVTAKTELGSAVVDALFLDIQMPVFTGFELLAHLESSPFVIFTTAFDQYALDAFEVNSVDYLLKPVAPERLDRALDKLEPVLRGAEARPPLDRSAVEALMRRMAEAVKAPRQYLQRISTRTGNRLQFLELVNVTHFFSEDKLTFAATPEKNFIVDFSIAELEQRLDPDVFFRIHRATLVNLTYLLELDAWFGGRAIARLKDAKRTELQVARDRVRVLREKLAGNR